MTVVAVNVGVLVGGSTVNVAVGVPVSVAVGGKLVLVGVPVAVPVVVIVGVSVPVAVSVAVGVQVKVAVGVLVGVLVGVRVGGTNWVGVPCKVPVGAPGVWLGRISVVGAMVAEGIRIGVRMEVATGLVGGKVAVTRTGGLPLPGLKANAKKPMQ
jgi:hypothetical protein